MKMAQMMSAMLRIWVRQVFMLALHSGLVCPAVL